MDHVDRILEQWRSERPDLDPSPMAVIGRLSRVTAKVDAELSTTFKKHSIDGSTFDVLATLRRQGPPFQLTPAELAAEAMITTGAVAQRLNRLESAGLIRRRPDPEDGRGKLVDLTEQGQALVDRVLPDHLETEHRLLQDLTDAERAALAALLARLDL
ncbi:MarR family winged helix-turn-helix transcriptional regulator [Schumannella sp. 10F1B-5-1]|uniref:MarR family winged helix-turn-helix transcriptional regulator n=1 Tax=Schumannella sp. 10F1B-5-1 TaxID=2590780 RepID=UPI00113021EE|nr:MarR family transcriptional regulator [Schumannella sp. 10F1B-5-1]TPW70182.1 MarR family transcriptional regulator [Schumannella sp. 10F1B-5-1]